MAESVPVRCPVCRREHLYAAPVYPCPCGAPVAAPLATGVPAEPVTHRTWEEDWVTVRCEACGRSSQWPRPELGCACGATLRVPVREAPRTPGTAIGLPLHTPLPPTAPSPTLGFARAGGPPSRPAFQPVTIRTARDAVTAAALYLRWLGYQDIRQAEQRPPTGVGLVARGVVAQVEPTVRPASLRDVECLWLTGMTESAVCVYFSLAGYADDARARADGLGVPLFVIDLTGTPQPLNGPADDLVSTGA